MTAEGSLAAFVAIAFALAGCSRGVDERAGEVAPAATVPAPAPSQKVDPALQPVVVFKPTSGQALRVPVEVVRSQKLIRKGLMYRQHLPADTGMLFLFKDEIVRSFWMKNTLIPLDMIFISSDMVVMGVVHNAEPRTLESREIGVATQFVVEVNAGWSATHSVAAGTVVTYQNIDAPPKPTPTPDQRE